MSKAGTVTIDHLEVKKRDMDILKKTFKVKDNAEAVKIAIDSMTGNLEIKEFFKKHKGVRIKKVYD